ncbi:lipid-transfer protein [Streptomyces sp. NPDC001982]|uniref:thiolase C-terminal domain-containing protein n=1 Tax=Streptomyces sp. NPDC001982 TaxID=3154405 RepID=UPI003319B114
MTRRAAFLGKTAIAGVGYTPLTKKSGRTVLSLAREACSAALDDAGVQPSEIDGIVSYSLFNDSVPVQSVATALGNRELTFALDLNLGGQAPSYAVALAAMAVESGMANNVLVFRALNGRSAVRIGSQSFASPTTQYRYPVGLTAFPQAIALWGRRLMIEHGLDYSHLGAVAVQQRRYAELNERAIRRRPLSIDEYMEADFVVDPFRSHDCTSEVDGACAVLVTSRERARDLRQPPAVIEGAAWTTPAGSGLDMADFSDWPDLSRNCIGHLASNLWTSARMKPTDVTFAEIYDCFSTVVLFGLEGLGLVSPGEGGEFVKAGMTALDGDLPVNTHGGLLCEGYLHGMNTVAEAVQQIQGRGGSRQVPDPSSCVVTSGALQDGSALVLTVDA